MDTISQAAADALSNSSPANKNADTGARVKDLETAMNLAQPFCKTATITSAAAATAVSLLADSEVPTGKKCYVTGFIGRVNGTTVWATTATVKIQDTNSSAVDFVTMAVAALTSQARVYPGTANVTTENAMANGTGGTASKGLQLKGDANGTGSDLIVTVTGFFK
jgi:hypothetical protein